jgi:RimJ/RimL family protein N-acetyltransferase
MTMTRYAFDELGLHRLEDDIIEYNEASMALVKKCGWLVEGTPRQSVFRRGRFWDLVQISILAGEYKGVVTQTDCWEE